MSEPDIPVRKMYDSSDFQHGDWRKHCHHKGVCGGVRIVVMRRLLQSAMSTVWLKPEGVGNNGRKRGIALFCATLLVEFWPRVEIVLGRPLSNALGICETDTTDCLLYAYLKHDMLHRMCHRAQSLLH